MKVLYIAVLETKEIFSTYISKLRLYTVGTRNSCRCILNKLSYSFLSKNKYKYPVPCFNTSYKVKSQTVLTVLFFLGALHNQ